MKNVYSYSLISRQISSDLASLVQTSPDHVLSLDDAFLAVAIPLTQLDYDHLLPMEKEKRHVKRMARFLDSKAKRSRFADYSRDAVREALEKEFLPQFEGEDDMKVAFLSDVRIIADVDEEGWVTLDEKLCDVYSKTQFEPIAYGTLEYGQVIKLGKVVKREKAVLTNYAVPDDLKEALEPYIEDYKVHWNVVAPLEEYKWTGVKEFQRLFNLESDNLSENLKASLTPIGNLLAGSYYYARSMMVKFANYSKEETRQMFRDLYDENLPLSRRVEKFIEDCKRILEINIAKGNFSKSDHHQQSERSVSVYLALMYPNKHYIYKYSLYSDIRSLLDLNLPSLSMFESGLFGYELFCDQLRQILMEDKELLALNDKTYPDDVSDYHLLVQDFLYYVSGRYQYFKDGKM